MTNSLLARKMYNSYFNATRRKRRRKNGSSDGRHGNLHSIDSYRPHYRGRSESTVEYPNAQTRFPVTQKVARQAREDELHLARLDARQNEPPDETRRQELLELLKDKKRNVEILEIEAELREFSQRERELLEAQTKVQPPPTQAASSPFTPMAGAPRKRKRRGGRKKRNKKGALNPQLYTDQSGGQVPQSQEPFDSIAKVQLVPTPLITWPSKLDFTPPPRFDTLGPCVDTKRRRSFPHIEDRDAPTQYGHVATQSLDYDGYNDEAIRYGGGTRHRSYDTNCNAATAGGRSVIPSQTKAAEEVKPQIKVNKQALQRRIQQLRRKTPAPVAQTQEPKLPRPLVDIPPLPPGVIPGIGPEWEEYMRAFHCGAGV